jgi:spore photoproduct lyase
MGNDRKKAPDDEERIEDQEAEQAAAEAEAELREDADRLSEREYQKMAGDLRWEVLEYVDAHPEKSVIEVAEFFGLREGSIRAWKAHRTMGTYQSGAANHAAPSPAAPNHAAPSHAAPAPAAKPDAPARRPPRQPDLFRGPKEQKPPPYLERKRFSNFIHYFDKTPPGIVCPHFHILAHANGCPFACAYCYLRLTLRHYPEPTVFSNTARLFQELRDWLLTQEDPAVLNAGELSDALAWDHSTMLSNNIVPLFAAQKRHKLLLLTKSVAINNLLEMEPTPQVIVSFSVNAPAVSIKYEPGAPPPLARLAAAKKLKAAGWEVRVRLDPLIPVPGWETAYGEIIAAVNELGPAVVTIGSLRFFRTLINHAPPTDAFDYGTDHGDPDNRLRVPQDVREGMYRFCLDRIKCLRIGLCKETVPMHRRLGLLGGDQSCNCTIE